MTKCRKSRKLFHERTHMWINTEQFESLVDELTNSGFDSRLGIYDRLLERTIVMTADGKRCGRINPGNAIPLRDKINHCNGMVLRWDSDFIIDKDVQFLSPFVPWLHLMFNVRLVGGILTVAPTTVKHLIQSSMSVSLEYLNNQKYSVYGSAIAGGNDGFARRVDLSKIRDLIAPPADEMDAKLKDLEGSQVRMNNNIRDGMPSIMTKKAS